MKIVECIPNFSEGRRLDVVAQIAQALASVDEVAILHTTSDADHNRSVITFAGTPDAVVEAAYHGIRVASANIDLRAHAGQHPRIGAADVVPFVPIAGLTQDDCVQLAHTLGRRVGEELGLPVYLYEVAAQKPERRNLAMIRRGGYERLAQTIQEPEWWPDYGPAQLGPAGAVIIGVRDVLIAFNVFLDTSDVEVARAVAQKIRESDGGLPAVKALGLLVNGLAQVSMNLTNYRITPIHRVLEAIRLECKRYGVAIKHSELIGLVPQEAILMSAAQYLQLDNLDATRLLEWQMARHLPDYPPEPQEEDL